MLPEGAVQSFSQSNDSKKDISLNEIIEMRRLRSQHTSNTYTNYDGLNIQPLIPIPHNLLSRNNKFIPDLDIHITGGPLTSLEVTPFGDHMYL